MNDIVPEDPKKALTTCAKSSPAIVDMGDFLEVQAGYATNIVIGFGRICGRSGGHHRQPALR
jgi:methylmalonyl-CoA carboxyltransferase 12S subunit